MLAENHPDILFLLLMEFFDVKEPPMYDMQMEELTGLHPFDINEKYYLSRYKGGRVLPFTTVFSRINW